MGFGLIRKICCICTHVLFQKLMDLRGFFFHECIHVARVKVNFGICGMVVCMKKIEFTLGCLKNIIVIGSHACLKSHHTSSNFFFNFVNRNICVRNNLLLPFQISFNSYFRSWNLRCKSSFHKGGQELPYFCFS